MDNRLYQTHCVPRSIVATVAAGVLFCAMPVPLAAQWLHYPSVGVPRTPAGTPNMAGAAGFGAAIDYLSAIDRAAALAHEDDVLAYATAKVGEIPGVRIIGEAREKTGVLSFLLEGAHPHDAGTILDQQGIAVRTGQHCAQPVMDRFCIPATIRASLAIYNTREDIDALVRGLHKVKEVFA